MDKFVEKEGNLEEYLESYLHNIRIYLERNGRPFNYLESEEQINFQFLNRMINKLESVQNSSKLSKDLFSLKEKQVKQNVLNKAVKKFREFYDNEIRQRDSEKGLYRNNREILTEVFYKHLYLGLLEIKKLQPSDQFEFLSDYLYQRSTEVRAGK